MSASPLTSTATMVISVTRNQPPYFVGSQTYNSAVPDKAEIGTTVITVSARDNDDSVRLLLFF